MKSLAIISEYNPCHKGHAYQIEKARELTGSDIIIALMSGNFVQRGIPAVFDKYTRAGLAVLSGADIVIELPTVYATSSAEGFAYYAIDILNRLNAVDYISFGMENDNLSVINEIAKILSDEPKNYRILLKKYMRKGFSAPLSREYALSEYLSNTGFRNILSMPNNILALEYIKALHKTSSAITPVPVKRIGNGYNDAIATTPYPSATAIRNMYKNNDTEGIRSSLLPDVYDYISCKKPLFEEDFSMLLNQSILLNRNFLHEYSDIDEKLSNRINNLFSSGNYYKFNGLAAELKSKNYTYTRICRSLIHILLGIKDNDIKSADACRVLAFNKAGGKFLKDIRDKSGIKLICDLSEAKNILKENTILQKDILSSDIYRLAYFNKYNENLTDEYRHKPEIINS